jgi:hypothetical protein
MTVEVCANPIFIIGSPRSGTTALAHALGRHRELWVSKESYFIFQLCGNDRISQIWDHNMKRETPSWLRHENVGSDEFAAYVGLGLNALFTSRSEGRRWIDQTPAYTPMVNDLAAMFPGAQFLHALRDGRAVVRSMNNFEQSFDASHRARMTDELPKWVHDLGHASHTWSAYVETAEDFAAAHPGRCLTVRNEELSSDPEAGFETIATFLGIDCDVHLARAYSGPRINSSFKARAERPPDDDFSGWDPPAKALFAELAGSTLVRTGYETDASLAAWVNAASAITRDKSEAVGSNTTTRGAS